MKTFTYEQAIALLPQVKELLEDLLSMRDQVIAGGATLESILRHAGGNGGSKAGGKYVLLLQRFQTSLETMQQLGVELKDLDQGLVDFPSYRDGELVYLCWKRGEETIAYWHTIDAGFAGRKPL